MNGMSRLIRKNSISPQYLKLTAKTPKKLLAMLSSRPCGALASWRSVLALHRRRAPDLTDRNLVELALATVVEVDDGARDHHRAEHRGQDAETVHDREASDRPGAERQQREPCYQRGHVRVENRVPG